MTRLLMPYGSPECAPLVAKVGEGQTGKVAKLMPYGSAEYGPRVAKVATGDPGKVAKLIEELQERGLFDRKPEDTSDRKPND